MTKDVHTVLYNRIQNKQGVLEWDEKRIRR